MIAVAPESVGLLPDRLAQVMGIFDTAVTAERIAGAVFGIVRHGNLAFLQAAGYRDTAKTAPMRTDAIFPLASMTKPIASVAQGHVLLTDPLHSILPPFRDAKVLTIHGLEPAHSPITLLDLLRHTAGIGAVNLYPNSPIAKIYAEARVSDPEQTLAACIDALAVLPLMHQPGTIWDYSLATDVLSRVVEIVSGQSFARYVEEKITQPLKMVDTRFAVPEQEWGRLAEPAIDKLAGELPPRQDARKLPIRIGGSSGLVGTAADYLRFCQAMLDGGVLDGARVLGAGTVAHMFRDHLGPIPRDTPIGVYTLGPGVGFGLGFAVRLEAPEHPHPGSPGDVSWGGSYGTQFVIDPKLRMAAVMMVNQFNQWDWCIRVFRTLVHQTLAEL